MSNADGKVKSGDNGKTTANDIGNKDKTLGGAESSNKPDPRTVYDELARDRFTIARYMRDVRPARKIIPIITNKVSLGYS